MTWLGIVCRHRAVGTNPTVAVSAFVLVTASTVSVGSTSMCSWEDMLDKHSFFA